MAQRAASRVDGLATTVFAEMSALAAATGSVNLGQGFPDVDGPDAVKDVAAAALRDGFNQYPPGPGHLELREAVVEHRARRYGTSYDPASEVLVTTGATEAVAAAMLALVEPGDEVVGLEPCYDSYAASVRMAGGRLVPVPLRWPDYRLDPADLRSAVGPRTKVLLVNSPHNPTGRVLDDAELAALAETAVAHDLVVVTDEVYEHLVYGDAAHRPLAALPGMRERTLAVSSAGKTFSFTGWKIGWACGPADLVTAVRAAKQYLTFVSGGPFQPAVAHALRDCLGWVEELRASLEQRRDLLCGGLTDLGLEPAVPAGTYFVTTDVRRLGWDDDVAFCRALPERAGVVAIPCSTFCVDPADPQGPVRGVVRWAFCKRPDVLEEGLRRLAAGRLQR